MTTVDEQLAAFKTGYDRARAVFTSLPDRPLVEVIDGYTTISTENDLTSDGRPHFIIPVGFDVQANEDAHHVCEHETGHAYLRVVERATGTPRASLVAAFATRFGYPPDYAVPGYSAGAVSLEEAWAETFANATFGAIVTTKSYQDETVDPQEARAWLLSLVAPAQGGSTVTTPRVLWQLSHHSALRPDGWSGAPDEGRWIREDLTPRVVDACTHLGIEVVLVDGDLGVVSDDNDTKILTRNPQYADDYDAFVSPHYEANLHESGGWVWGRAAASPTGDRDDILGRIWERRYSELCNTTGGPAPHFEWLNPNITNYYAFRDTSANTPGILVEHGVGWNVPSDYDYSWLRAHVQEIADCWALTLLEFATGTVLTGTGGPKVVASVGGDDMTADQEAKLDRVLQLLEAREPLVWIARDQRGLDVETGKPFNTASTPVDPRIKT